MVAENQQFGHPGDPTATRDPRRGARPPRRRVGRHHPLLPEAPAAPAAPPRGPHRLVRRRPRRPARPHQGPPAPGLLARGHPPLARRRARPRRRAARGRGRRRAAPATPTLLDLDELAARVGIPAPLLDAVAREGLVVPQHRDGREGYTDEDADVLRSGLRLLEAGFPLPDLLALGEAAPRRHARDRQRRGRDVRRARAAAVAGVDRSPTTRRPSAWSTRSARCCPTVTTLVAHHFRSLLLEVAQEHLEAVGDPSELAAARSEPGWEPARDRAGARPRRHASRGRREAPIGRGHVRPAGAPATSA